MISEIKLIDSNSQGPDLDQGEFIKINTIKGVAILLALLGCVPFLPVCSAYGDYSSPYC